MSRDEPHSEPLAGKTILAACSAAKVERLIAGLGALGARVIPFPTIVIRAVEDTRILDAALAALPQYQWVIFTSEHGVEYFRRYLDERKVPAASRRLPRACAIGPATARAAEKAGFRLALTADEHLSEGVVEALLRDGVYLAGCRILLPRALEGRDALPRALLAAGAVVDIVPCYETLERKPSNEEVGSVVQARPDMVLFTSPSTVGGWLRIFGLEHGLRMLRRASIAALGPTTASALRENGIEPAVRPPQNTIESLIQAVAAYYSLPPAQKPE